MQEIIGSPAGLRDDILHLSPAVCGTFLFFHVVGVFANHPHLPTRTRVVKNTGHGRVERYMRPLQGRNRPGSMSYRNVNPMGSGNERVRLTYGWCFEPSHFTIYL